MSREEIQQGMPFDSSSATTAFATGLFFEEWLMNTRWARGAKGPDAGGRDLDVWEGGGIGGKKTAYENWFVSYLHRAGA